MEKQIISCEQLCPYTKPSAQPALVVLTGGPGAGKTAVLEFARKVFCENVAILPEAAGILFSGGFWRLDSASGIRSAQRAIYHVQTEIQNMFFDENKWAIGLCDRGTLDGLAYWQGSEEDFFESLGTNLQTELNKYKSVIHLRVPSMDLGYNNQNPIRIENAELAIKIDERIHEIWRRHPNYFQISSVNLFTNKVLEACDLIRTFLPMCCQNHFMQPLKETKKKCKSQFEIISNNLTGLLLPQLTRRSGWHGISIQKVDGSKI